MRIGIFTETYKPYISGLVTSVDMLKESLEKMGHIVYIVTANLESFKYEYNSNERILKIPGFKTGIYDSRLTSVYPIRAVNRIKSWNLDVIHSQTEFAIGTFARLLSKQLNIPLIHTYHTMYEDYIHYITKGHFDKSSKKILEYLTLFYCDKTVNELIVPTKKTFDLFKEKYLVDRNIYIIPTGIDITRFYLENLNEGKLASLKKKYNINDSCYVGIFMGRIASEKNITFLFDVVKKILKSIPNFKLLVVGDGPDKLDYMNLCKKNNIDDNVIFTGKVDWSETPYYYHLSDIFLTSSRSETQGLTVIEAMASSIPVMVIDDDSFKQTVINMKNGIIFNDVDDCCKKIIKLYKDKKLCNKLVENAKETAYLYSSSVFAKKVLDVYENALNNKNKNLSIVEKLVDKLIKDDFK